MASDEEHESAAGTIAMPAPTAWPFVASFGLALVVAGFVTSLVVTVVGVVLLGFGLVGWGRDLLPVELHEAIEIAAVEARAAPASSTRGSVAHLTIGRESHRVRVPAEIHPYSAGIKAGIAGGAAMAIVAMAYGVIAQGSPWYPINLLSAAAMPQLAAADTAQLKEFNAIAFGLGFVSHGLLSVLVGLVYAVMLPMFPSRYNAVWGGIVAPTLWTGLVWASLGVLNPTLNERVNWTWFIVSQIAFGLVTGFIVARSRKIETMQTWPLAVRLGLETQGMVREKDDAE